MRHRQNIHFTMIPHHMPIGGSYSRSKQQFKTKTPAKCAPCAPFAVHSIANCTSFIDVPILCCAVATNFPARFRPIDKSDEPTAHYNVYAIMCVCIKAESSYAQLCCQQTILDRRGDNCAKIKKFSSCVHHACTMPMVAAQTLSAVSVFVRYIHAYITNNA